MKTWHKALLAVVLSPIIAVGGYIAYFGATYINKTTRSGPAYGFTTGSTKAQALEAIFRHRDTHPRLATYVSYGPRAGDHFTLGASDMNLANLGPHDQWDVLLDGPGEFFNSIKLTFDEGRLIEIHRHRKNFELP
jgi:hypothetical protein